MIPLSIQKWYADELIEDISKREAPSVKLTDEIIDQLYTMLGIAPEQMKQLGGYHNRLPLYFASAQERIYLWETKDIEPMRVYLEKLENERLLQKKQRRSISKK